MEARTRAPAADARPRFDAEPPPIIDQHPRVVLGPKIRSVVERRIETTHQTEWAHLLVWARAFRHHPEREEPRRLPAALRRYTWLAALSRRDEFVAEAGRLADVLLALPQEDRFGSEADRLEALAHFYDNCHDQVSEERLDDVRQGMRALASRVRRLIPADRDLVTGRGLHHLPGLNAAAVALHGEGHDEDDALLADVLELARPLIETHAAFLADGCSPLPWGYSTLIVTEIVRFLLQYESATPADVDIFARHRWLEGFVSWVRWGLRSDGTFHRLGDYLGGREPFSSRLLFVPLALIAWRLEHREAAWLLRQIDCKGMEHVRLLLEDREGPAWRESGAAMSQGVRLFEPIGTAICRDDDLVLTAKASPCRLSGHDHADAGSFTLYLDEDLILDSGLYDVGGSVHHRFYYQRTIAHNALLAQPVSAPPQAAADGAEPPDDGGQPIVDWVQDLEAYDFAAARPRARLRHRRLDGADLFLCEAGGSYDPRRVRSWHRALLLLRPVDERSPHLLIIDDRLTLAQTGMRVSVLLHTVGRPVADERWIRVDGSRARLWMQPLWPTHAAVAFMGDRFHYEAAGRTCPPQREPMDDEQPGNWRIETIVRPHQTDVHLLHVIAAGRMSDAAAPPTLLLEGNSLIVNGRTVLIRDDPTAPLAIVPEDSL